MQEFQRITVVDSHTGGEPTRIVIAGGPNLSGETLQDRVNHFRDEFDDVRSSLTNEPRGSDVIVGGMLTEPIHPESSAAVIFFDNECFIGMCGHGTIGLMVTLKHLNRISIGRHQIETAVGIITAKLLDDQTVIVNNVSSYRLYKEISIDVPDYAIVTGDVAWGGNWFFLVKQTDEELQRDNVQRLTEVTLRIRAALRKKNITGLNDAPIDHVLLFGDTLNADSRNFVLCPGGAYDRSPCGTGTSAKMACLAADGRLKPGDVWRQESIVGSIFEGWVQPCENPTGVEQKYGAIQPSIKGSAFITAESTIILDPNDPFRAGIV